MNGAVINKLEIDVMNLNEVTEASQYALKYKLPALVVHPGLSSEAIIARDRAGGKYQIITPIDWPKGETFGMNKMRGLYTDNLESDGFEIMLTPDKLELETRNEAKVLTDFIKTRIAEDKEVRFVLGTVSRTEDNVLTMCRGLLTVRTPAYIRTDNNLKTQVSKANTDEHNRVMELVRSVIRVPMKVSGNLNNLKSVVSIPSASRYGVSLAQAKTIIKEFKSQPDRLNELLNKTSE
jgi:hypothetical protein